MQSKFKYDSISSKPYKLTEVKTGLYVVKDAYAKREDYFSRGVPDRVGPDGPRTATRADDTGSPRGSRSK